MTHPDQRRFRFSVEAADPIYSGEAFCARCGLTFTVIVVTDEANPLAEGVSVICKCGRGERVSIEEPPDGLDA